MSYRPFVAEALGTFALTFVVWLSIAFAMPFATPVMAALTLGTFVYLVGPISGAHCNPAVTVGLLAVGKIKSKDAALYVVAQFVGATVALLLGRFLNPEPVAIPTDADLLAGFAEALGAAMLAFAVSSVAHGKTPYALSGTIVGLGLFLGIYIAFPFSNAVLNPAVAFGIGSFGPMYILGPFVGGVVGAWSYKQLYAIRR